MSPRPPRTRRRTATGLLAGALLALVACDPEEPPAVEEAAEVLVTVPGDPPGGDLSRPTAVTVAADGTRTVLVRGTDGAGLATVSADGARTGAVVVPGTSDLFAVVPSPAGAVAVGWADGEGGAGGSVVLVPVDAARGTTGTPVPVATPSPGEVYPGLSRATALPGGRVVVALTRVGGQAPLLLVVDPATAVVSATAEVELGDTLGGAGVVDVADLAVDPEGTRIAVGVVAHSRDWGGSGFRSVLATVDAGLRPDGPTLDLASDATTAQVEAVAVDSGGTAYAVAVVGDDRDTRLLAVAPGAAAAESLGDPDVDLLPGQAADLAVADGAAWVLHQVPGDGDGTSLTRVDLADGSASAPRGLCDGQAGGLAVEPDGDVVAVAECGFEGRLWVLSPVE